MRAATTRAPKIRSGGVTLEDYLGFPHVETPLYGPRNDVVSTALEQLGLTRQVGVSSATFAPSFPLLYHSPLIATVPAGVAIAACQVCRDLLVFEVPFAIPHLPYTMIWHKRNDMDAAVTWKRALLSKVAQQALGSAVVKVMPAPWGSRSGPQG